MARSTTAARSAAAWALARRQHWVVGRRELMALGFTAAAIDHRVKTGRLRLLARGVYSVGRPEPTAEGRWMAAILACGEGAALTHRSAAALWGIGRERGGVVEVSVPCRGRSHQRGIRVRCRPALPECDLTLRRGIPITTPPRTVLDLALEVGPRTLERLVNEADNHDLVSPVVLNDLLADRFAGVPGAKPLRDLLDPLFFRLSDSELEVRFRPLARRAGLPEPETQVHLSGHRVDFFFQTLGLVVEADSLRYHRTPATQRRDALRDQEHTAAGLTPLRFTHWQIANEAGHVVSVLGRTAAHLSRT